MKIKICFWINTFFSILYLVWRIFFTIPFGCGWLSVMCGVILLVLEALGMVEAFVHFMNMHSVSDYKVPDVPKERFPHIDVYISTYSEEPELLYKTINGCKNMEYPDKSKVHIYLCDDNRRPEMEELAKKMGVNYLKRADNKGAKAGNLNHALAHSTSPYVLTFDADMIPQKRFLMQLVPYLVDAEMKNENKKEEDKIKIGFIQSPQNFYNPDLFQFNLFSEDRIPNEQDYFYKDIQAARTKSNSVIYGGSNTIISREALEAIGGFFTDAITEDFATGILIQRAGFVCLGTSDPLASGLSPTDIPNLIQQRIRWGRGVIATGRKMHIYTAKDLSLSQKLNYWASIWYWYSPVKRLVYMVSPILYAAFGFTIFKCTLPQVLAFWLPMYLTSNLALSQLSGNVRSNKWTGIYETIMFPYMLLPITLETFGITLKKFKVTQKSQMSGKQHYELYMIPFLILIALSALGIIRCIAVIFDSSSFGPAVVLFWMIMNLYYMVMAVLFIDGRAAYRKSERIPLEMPCTFTINGIERQGVTVDVSEEGLAVQFDKPYFIDEEAEVPVALNWENCDTNIVTKLVYVKRHHEQWRYAMVITNYKDSYNEWLNIVYNRIPPLPSEIIKDSGSYDDIMLNTNKRLDPPSFQKRIYPRVLLNYDGTIVGEEETKVHIKNFNYACINLAISNGPKKMVIRLFDDVTLSCSFVFKSRGKNCIYRIENMQDIIEDKEKYAKLLDFLVVNNKKARGEDKLEKTEKRRREKEEERRRLIVFDELDCV
ncbi:MAG: glycosyltransferase [Butyrivibrio sp.]|nr:glycosyltransferase [Butyrivibrio sp.]